MQQDEAASQSRIHGQQAQLLVACRMTRALGYGSFAGFSTWLRRVIDESCEHGNVNSSRRRQKVKLMSRSSPMSFESDGAV